MTPLRIPRLGDAPDSGFPPPESALQTPDGLLAIGGDLSSTRLLDAYRHGIFPWFSEGEPPLWWCPDPRTVFRTARVARSRRFRRGLRGSTWEIRADTAFDRVVDACASIPRRGQDGTWITGGMHAAYGRLHRLGHAHSVEVFEGDALVGGLYGVAVGCMFFGESMFSARPEGSKVAIAALAHVLHGHGWPLIDAQVENPHLMSLGAELWPRSEFLAALATLTARRPDTDLWAFRLSARDLAASG